MNDNVLQALEAQIGHEFHASQTYLSMAGYFEAESLGGFASWMRQQSQEEIVHAMRIFDYLVDTGYAPRLPALPPPAHDFTSPLGAFEAAFEHEKKVTGQITALYELAQDAKDYKTQVLLQWFITEQVEEEKLTGGLVDRLKMVEGSRSALLILDAELASRQGAPEAARN